MSNPCNFGTIVGHAASEPRFFENRAGGATVKLAVFARNSFVNKSTGEVESEIVELTSYLPDANVPGVFGFIGTGDRVAVSYSLRTDCFTDKSGVERFELVARIDSVQLIDSKSESAARAAKRGAKAGAKVQAKTQAKQPAMAGANAVTDSPPF
ncbi:single-strand DNA-binding protein [Arcanobacterium pluranimalium]|uniref:single-stranded DNA-binding protein n=1 Tax=Arcanobacterium pluranimalium TaxID=108028 RepID=UPI00195751EA|nr:single-stranded DNA-binding protein [Arcanobacterium pluranimalium]MBM7825798.1 single-strand DNA-binding protein [Arcanobacterium pluranimalium]